MPHTKGQWSNNSNMKRAISLLLLFILMSAHQSFLLAQGKASDYKRAFNIRREYSSKVKNADIRPFAIADSHKFGFTLQGKDSLEMYVVDAESGEITRASSNDASLRRHRQRDSWQWPRRNDANHQPTWHEQQHHWMEVDPETDACGNTHLPNGMVLTWRKGNLWIKEREATDGHSATVERQLTTDGVDTFYYSIHATLSPDGQYLATTKIKPAPIHTVTWVNSSPDDRVQPIYKTHQYTKPGDSLNYRVPVIINLATGDVREPSTRLFLHQYSVSAPRWDRDSRAVTFEFNERGHKTFRVLEMDLNAQVRTLIEETNPKYVAYSRNYRHDLSDGQRIIWKSDRTGYAHLYLYDRSQPSAPHPITNGRYWVRDVIKVDEKSQTIWFTANEMYPDEDPYFIHYYRIRFDGTGLTCLTPGNATHSAVFSHDMAYLIDTYSTVTTPPVSILRSGSDGHAICTIAEADISQLRKAGWTPPEVFVAKGRDGVTDMWGIIQRPSNFNPKKHYPVIEYIYSGPGDQYVPKSFSAFQNYLTDLAELGFIVVQVDGMTTSFRTLDFEQVCYKNLADAGLPDHIAWIRAAAKQYPYMDISNMGIYGCSAGGQEALGALLFHGDFYKVGFSACGCHDNRMDKIWWNEQWMGYPIDQSYADCSNVVNAHRLTGRLMLLVGEMDDNVDPSSTMQVVNALIKAGKDFDFVFLPGQNHTMGGTYGDHKRFDFFVKHLLGVTPPEWEKKH